MKYSSRFLIAGAFALSTIATASHADSVVFDNVTAPLAGATGSTVTATSSAPNTFLGGAYTLAQGTTSITGFDLFPANLSGNAYTALKLNLWVWGSVNTGAVSVSSPAFSNLLGSYSFTANGNFQTGSFFPFEGEGGDPAVTLAAPIALTGAAPTVGVTFNIQGSTDGVTFSTVQSLTSIITTGVAPTVGSMPFNGYYRNANNESDGNFVSGVRSLGLTNQGIGVRIYGDVAAVPEPGTWALMGLGLAAVAFAARRRRA